MDIRLKLLEISEALEAQQRFAESDELHMVVSQLLPTKGIFRSPNSKGTLRSKMYSILLDNGKEKKTGKGIKKSVLKKNISHEDYKRCILSSKIEDQRQKVSFNNLRTFNHDIYTYNYKKIGLSCSNDKQYLLSDGISSLSYGHYKLSNVIVNE